MNLLDTKKNQYYYEAEVILNTLIRDIRYLNEFVLKLDNGDTYKLCVESVHINKNDFTIYFEPVVYNTINNSMGVNIFNSYQILYWDEHNVNMAQYKIKYYIGNNNEIRRTFDRII